MHLASAQVHDTVISDKEGSAPCLVGADHPQGGIFDRKHLALRCTDDDDTRRQKRRYHDRCAAMEVVTST